MEAPSGTEDVDFTRTPPGKAYTAPDVTVYFDGTRCRHYAECIRGLPQVFDVSHRPWIQADAAPADDLAEVIRRCPSGALHYVLAEGPAEVGDAPTTIEPTSDGPLLVRGSLRLAPLDGDGPWTDETRMAACACGRTSNRPFCNGACQESSAHEDSAQHDS